MPDHSSRAYSVLSFQAPVVLVLVTEPMKDLLSAGSTCRCKRQCNGDLRLRLKICTLLEVTPITDRRDLKCSASYYSSGIPLCGVQRHVRQP